MPEPVYQRLTRQRVTQWFAFVRAPTTSLWLGNDHLLLMERTGYTETYKRFYFRDIQAITVRETSRRAMWNGILTAPLAVCLIGILVSLYPPANVSAVIVWSIFGIVFLLPVVINNFRGTACSCQLRTAVQTWDLPTLSRRRQTRRVLEKIRPLIVAAQGQLTAEDVSARMHAAVSETASAPQPEPRPAAEPPRPS